MKFAQKKYYLLIFSQLILLKRPHQENKNASTTFFISLTGCMSLKEH